MRRFMTASLAGLIVALTGCTRAEQAEVEQDLEAAGSRVVEETREVVRSPEVQEMGSEIKEAAGDVAQIAKGAVEGGQEAAADVADDEDETEPPQPTESR